MVKNLLAALNIDVNNALKPHLKLPFTCLYSSRSYNQFFVKVGMRAFPLKAHILLGFYKARREAAGIV